MGGLEQGARGAAWSARAREIYATKRERDAGSIRTALAGSARRREFDQAFEGWEGLCPINLRDECGFKRHLKASLERGL